MKLFNEKTEYPNSTPDQKIARAEGIRNRIILVETKNGTRFYRAFNTTIHFTISGE